MPVAVTGPASVFTTRKVAAYGAISVLSAVAVVLGAFHQRSNFYSAAVMLGRSNGCMMVSISHEQSVSFSMWPEIFLPPSRSYSILASS